jgi:hypothetical protein
MVSEGHRTKRLKNEKNNVLTASLLVHKPLVVMAILLQVLSMDHSLVQQWDHRKVLLLSFYCLL